ncbi:MAG: hypothetical protein IPL32_01155 [Chloracidobacterium sp.]|nr:hypothetical protein [Chloracidobacterium sp.]
MIELNINDGSYDRVLDAPIQDFGTDANVPASNDTAKAGEFKQPQDGVYPMAPAIAERGDYHRPMRRSTSIF